MVEVLVQLRVGSVDVRLIITALVVIWSLVEEPVVKLVADFSEAVLGNRITESIVAIRLGLLGRSAIVGIR